MRCCRDISVLTQEVTHRHPQGNRDLAQFRKVRHALQLHARAANLCLPHSTF